MVNEIKKEKRRKKMKNKQFWADWLFPIISLATFATLLASMLMTMDSIRVGSLLSYSSGLLAYTMMLTVTFIGSRPRFIEKHFGMPHMFEVHGVMSIVLTILIGIHVIIQWNGLQSIADMSVVSQTGWVAVIALLLVMFSGIFSLSGIFVNTNPTLRKFKENRNREVNLWLHRLAIVSDIFVFFHLFNLPFLRNNTLFIVLLSAYTIYVLGYYAVWKIRVETLPKYRVDKIYRGTPSLFVLEFVPLKGEIPQYNPGEYFWIHFKDADGITKEGHPFSTSSAITNRYNNSIEFMIKEAGDWTKALENVKEGDTATLEGPYGDMFPPHIQELDESVPFTLLAGGIGLTPMLSIARHEHKIGSQREIHLVWGLSFEEDMFMLEELEEMKKANPNFHVHIIFSNEEVEGYDFGFITNDYLEEKGAAHYSEGHFFVCGPEPMINAAKRILDNGNVQYDHRHIDDFGF